MPRSVYEWTPLMHFQHYSSCSRVDSGCWIEAISNDVMDISVVLLRHPRCEGYYFRSLARRLNMSVLEMLPSCKLELAGSTRFQRTALGRVTFGATIITLYL